VRQLSDQSGVVIKAGIGSRDWRVRERRVTIHAKEVPLGALLMQISKLLGFLLSHQDKEDQERSYFYWQDAKSWLLETELLNAQREAEAQRVRPEFRAPLMQPALL